MSNDQRDMSKRQTRREQRRRAQQRSRWITIGLICLGALLVVFGLVLPQLKPAVTVQSITPSARPDANGNSTGDPNSPVKLVEFSDYQCPFCQRFWENTESQVVDAYVKTNKVQFTFRSAGNWVSQNIGSGAESQNAAMAAYCAADQNKFWEMHDSLFTNVLGENVGSFTLPRLQAMAKSIGLDMTAFNSCFQSNKYLGRVNQDYQDAKAAGITGTPFFVISYTVNGQTKTNTIDGAQPFSAYQQALDAALAEADK
ncbi:MAG TPA: thioredoxin domain-containing protein [Anaerolineales bacterium]|nr:thioredoxin domain-containing protein [Anaerolineales bacterium]